MSYIKIIVCIALLSNVIVAVDGHGVGGGHAILCGKNRARTIELLDYWEARNLFPDFTIGLPEGTSEIEIVKGVLKRLEKLDRVRSQQYGYALNTFLNETVFTGEVLEEVHDYGYLKTKLPTDCTIEQLALQRAGALHGIRSYTIQRDLWNKLSTRDRAGLILHEIIYWEARQLGQTTSAHARHFNMLLSSSQISQMEAAAYAASMRKFGFDYAKPGQHLYWQIKPLDLRATTPDTLFCSYTLNFYVSSLTPKLEYELISGPKWLFIDYDLPFSAKLCGIPTPMDVGVHRFTLRVKTFEGLSDDVTAILTVEDEKTWNPTWMLSPPYFSQIAGRPWKSDLGHFVQAYPEQEYSFSMNGPKWMQYDPLTKTLYGTPTTSDAGEYWLTLKLKTAKGEVVIPVSGRVEKPSFPRQWIWWEGQEITFSAKKGSKFVVDLADYMINSENMRFRTTLKGNTMQWLSLSEDGKLLGVPNKSGLELITVELEFKAFGDFHRSRKKILLRVTE